MLNKIVGTIFLSALTGLLVWGAVGSSGNLKWCKDRAEAKWLKQGFQVVDYEGYQWGSGGFGTPFGGAKVWTRLKKIPDNGLTYTGYVIRWGDEIQIYGPRCLDGQSVNLPSKP